LCRYIIIVKFCKKNIICYCYNSTTVCSLFGCSDFCLFLPVSGVSGVSWTIILILDFKIYRPRVTTRHNQCVSKVILSLVEYDFGCFFGDYFYRNIFYVNQCIVYDHTHGAFLSSHPTGALGSNNMNSQISGHVKCCR